jgi:hypothetical protein
LSELIGVADGINHSIPTRDELASAIGALRAAGLLTVEGERFALTREGKALKRHWKGGLFNWSKTLLPPLAALTHSDEQFPLTDDQVHTAYLAYTRRM